MAKFWDEYRHQLILDFNFSFEIIPESKKSTLQFLAELLFIQPFTQNILQLQRNEFSESEETDQNDKNALKILFNFLNPAYWAAGIIKFIQRTGLLIDTALFGTPFDNTSLPAELGKGVGFFLSRGSHNKGYFTVDPNDDGAVKGRKYFFQLLALFTIRPILRGIPILLELPRLALVGIGKIQQFVTYDVANQTRKWLTNNDKWIPGLNSNRRSSRSLKMGLSIITGLMVPTGIALAVVFAGPLLLAALPGVFIPAIKSAFIAAGAWFASTVFSSATSIAIFASTLAMGSALLTGAALKAINLIANSKNGTQLSLTLSDLILPEQPDPSEPKKTVYNNLNSYNEKLTAIVQYYKQKHAELRKKSPTEEYVNTDPTKKTITIGEKLTRIEQKLNFYGGLIDRMSKDLSLQTSMQEIQQLPRNNPDEVKQAFKQCIVLRYQNQSKDYAPFVNHDVHLLESYIAARDKDAQSKQKPEFMAKVNNKLRN